MRRSNGFTVIELLFALALVIIIFTIALVEKNDLESSNRDRERKTAINSLYYGLTEGYFKQHKSYPPSISQKQLPFVDPGSFKDPSGKAIGQADSDYHYTATNCKGDICQDFSLTARLEKEADYKKSSK